MGTINLTLPSDGDTIEASDVNVPFNTIAAAINGNLDGNNLASGIQVANKESNPSKFRARRAAAWNSPNNAFAKISLDTEDFDTGSNYDSTTNYRFTAPIAGFYQFNGRVSLGTSGGVNLMIAALYKNGSIYLRGSYSFGSAAAGGGSTFSDLVQASAGDYFELWVFSGGAAAAETDVGSQAVFSGFLVSAT